MGARIQDICQSEDDTHIPKIQNVEIVSTFSSIVTCYFKSTDLFKAKDIFEYL